MNGDASNHTRGASYSAMQADRKRRIHGAAATDGRAGAVDPDMSETDAKKSQPARAQSHLGRRILIVLLLASLAAAFLLKQGTAIGGPTNAGASALDLEATAQLPRLDTSSQGSAMPAPQVHAQRRWAPWKPVSVNSQEMEGAKRSIAQLGLKSIGGTPDDHFLLGVRPSTGTVDVVSPVSDPTFSYPLPIMDGSVRLHWAGSGPKPKPLDRTEEGFHHLGDVTLRVRPAGSKGAYSTHSTVSRTPPLATAGPEALKVSLDGRNATIDATACVRPPLPSMRLQRSVRVDGDEAIISITLINDHSTALEIGGLGLSMPMNQMFSGRSLPVVAKKCSFTEVYLGGDAGYVQVTRTTGDGPVLLVLPGGGHGFEGWRPLKWEDRANYDWMHEMLYEIVLHSKAYAQAEWKNAQPWAPPSSGVVPAGGRSTYAVRLRLARDVESVVPSLLGARLPVAVPFPAPTIHSDMRDAKVQVLMPTRHLVLVGMSAEPAGCAEVAMTSYPTKVPDAQVSELGEGVSVATVSVIPRDTGRCRIDLKYTRKVGGPLVQHVHYLVLEPAAQLLQRHGDFASTVGWLPANSSDPWGRGPAFLGTDAEARNGQGAPLTEEPRVFMAGLSDESGASAPLAMAVKQLGLPSADEVAKLEDYVFNTLWAGASGDRKGFLQGADYAVRLSMLYWSDAIDAARDGPAEHFAPALHKTCHKCWATCSKKRDCCYWMHCWSEEHSLENWRAYNYPHVAVGYWALYRLGRHYSPPLTKRADWRFYLEQAARTTIAMYKFGGRGTSQWGLMVGSIFALVLRDLEREGMASLASEVERIKERRMAKWMSMPFPYGSEFPWDSTGHEEIHTWLMRDGKYAAANKTVQAVLAYSSVVPHWAYCGSARRYWDFTINGKTQWGNEREFHHYGSTLNGIAVLDSYRAYPSRHHLLQLGSCSLLGHLSNIHPSGAASMAWHGDPGLLRRDGYSGDYGPGLYGYWRSAASYVACIPPHGWQCVLCDVQEVQPLMDDAPMREVDLSETSGCDGFKKLRVTPRDAFQRRVYLAPLGLLVSVEAATIVEVTVRPADLSVSITLQQHARAPSSTATLFIEAERIEPPPPRPATWYKVKCGVGQGALCSVKGADSAATGKSTTAEYIVSLARTGSTTLELGQ